MRTRRVYLPLDLENLQELTSGGSVAAAGTDDRLVAFAVTREVAAAMPEDDEEEREYDALLECAVEAAGRAGAARRVIASADVDAGGVEEEPGGYARVRLSAAVPLAQIVSFHVDELPAHVDEDLMWYDVTELDEVGRLVTGEE